MKAITIPPYLKKGDTIAIVCPAGFMERSRTDICAATLTQWGFNVKIGTTVGGQDHYFSGTDAERLEDLQQALDDAEVKAVLCGRGGYGVSRIIDQLDFKKFRKNPKWIIGYSDITLLHTHLNVRLNVASLHSPMAGAFAEYGADSEYIAAFKKALTGRKTNYTITPYNYNQTGTASGTLIGGNLCLLAHSIGTPSEVQTKGRILFIEEIGEYIYSVDRMFLQLKRAGKLEHLAGLIIGSFTDMKDTANPFGKDIYTAIKEHMKDYSYPMAFDFPVGHTERNFPLKEGVEHTLRVAKIKYR